MKLKTLLLAALLLAAFIAPAFSQEMPALGTVIDKSNYKKYAHLFPEEFAPAFENGFGIIKPIQAKVVSATPVQTPKAYLSLSTKTKGKFGLDAKGMITGGYDSNGFPFPDLQKSDKNFTEKLMWNYAYRYYYDDLDDNATSYSFEKRKGEPGRVALGNIYLVLYKGRIVASQKPELSNPFGLYKSMVFHYLKPESVKNTITLTYRYTDLSKPDDTYLYLPSMRRVLRAEAGQRSVPMVGGTNALDDFFGFDGRTMDFTYSLVKEQKVLAVSSKLTLRTAQALQQIKTDLPFPYDNYELKDTYVIDIKPKDPRYPQSKKRIWIDKTTLQTYYAVAWDRSDKLWKVWAEFFNTYGSGDNAFQVQNASFGVDIQFGITGMFCMDPTPNKGLYTYSDFTPATLLKIAR